MWCIARESPRTAADEQRTITTYPHRKNKQTGECLTPNTNKEACVCSFERPKGLNVAYTVCRSVFYFSVEFWKKKSMIIHLIIPKNILMIEQFNCTELSTNVDATI